MILHIETIQDVTLRKQNNNKLNKLKLMKQTDSIIYT